MSRGISLNTFRRQLEARRAKVQAELKELYQELDDLYAVQRYWKREAKRKGKHFENVLPDLRKSRRGHKILYRRPS